MARVKALEKLVWLLAPLGVLLMAGAPLWGLFKQPLPGGTSVYVIVGAALVLMHLLLAWETVANALGRRQMAYGATSVVLIAAVAGILIGINWYVARNTKRWDLTKAQRFSLSDATKTSLGNLKDDVKITYF